METQIRTSLNKLELLSKIIPQEDARAIKALQDYQELKAKFAALEFQDDAEEGNDEEMKSEESTVDEG